MADIQYKKGELLFSGDITTTNQNGGNIGTYSPFSSQFDKDKLIVEFDGIEYTCEANDADPYTYGAYSTQGVDFTNYPFGFKTGFGGDKVQQLELILYTENPGTYNIKIYEAVADISDMIFKKGELLLNETFETVKENEEDEISQAIKPVSALCTEDIVIIDFNGTEYTCVGVINPGTLGVMYGGFDINYGPDFTDYPFIFMTAEIEGQYGAVLAAENSGTYTLKVYTAIEDTDSTPLSPTDFIIAYLMASPQNSNWNVLSTLLGDGDWSQLKAYVEMTPKNMNRQVLKALLGSGSSGGAAVVGTAVVGTDVVG